MWLQIKFRQNNRNEVKSTAVVDLSRVAVIVSYPDDSLAIHLKNKVVLHDCELGDVLPSDRDMVGWLKAKKEIEK